MENPEVFDGIELVMTMRSVNLQRETKMPLRVRQGQSANHQAALVAEAYGATVVALAYEDGRPFEKTDQDGMQMQL